MANLDIKYQSVTALNPRPNNPRTHSKKQLRQIADSIRQFGFTNPVWQAGEVVSGTASLTGTFTITIGGVQLAASDILYAGLAPQLISGVYQFNVRVPASVADGDQPVIVTVGGVASPSGATLPVKR